MSQSMSQTAAKMAERKSCSKESLMLHLREAPKNSRKKTKKKKDAGQLSNSKLTQEEFNRIHKKKKKGLRMKKTGSYHLPDKQAMEEESATDYEVYSTHH